MMATSTDENPSNDQDAVMAQAQDEALQDQFHELPENCSNARYLDIQAKKLMGSGSFGKSILLRGVFFHSKRVTSVTCHWPCWFINTRLTASLKILTALFVRFRLRF